MTVETDRRYLLELNYISYKMSQKKNVLVMFGDISPEHEVSVITGLQVAEKIDRSSYNPYVVYVDKSGLFYFLPRLKDRKDFKKSRRELCYLGRDTKGSFLQAGFFIPRKTYIDAAYLAFHGGHGEGGQVQGMLEVLDIPFTSPSMESSAITMNKALTKEVLDRAEVPNLQALSIKSDEYTQDPKKVIKKIVKKLGIPVIIKPAHLGSSIGLEIVKTSEGLDRALSSVSLIDNEILVEKFISDFMEYNVSVREINGKLEFSEIEKPISHEEVLTFAEKYQKRGGKKFGGNGGLSPIEGKDGRANSGTYGQKGAGGMANLHRELPAKIDAKLKAKILEMAEKAFRACRCSGFVRIDFMYTKSNDLYLTEINSIPGSVAFFLWEASGESFKEQITKEIEQGIINHQQKLKRRLDYKTDIVEKFVST